MILSAGMPSTLSSTFAKTMWSACLTGAKLTPQLPRTNVVMPCQHVGVPSGSHINCASMCVCVSTKPGVTSLSVASITRCAASETSLTAVIRSPLMATSALKPGLPVPSITVPLRMTRSCTVFLLYGAGYHLLTPLGVLTISVRPYTALVCRHLNSPAHLSYRVSVLAQSPVQQIHARQ